MSANRIRIPHKTDTSNSTTYLILGLFERPVNVIVRFPDPWHAVLVVPEPLLKVPSQLAQEDRIGRLFVHLGPQRQPSPLPQRSQCRRVLLLRAIETCERIKKDTV